MMNQNKFKIVSIILVVILIAIAVYFSGILKQNKSYSIVYLSTGEVYVGKLSTFPVMEFKNGYILGTTKDATDPTKSNFQLNPLADALWSPQYLRINRDHVIFYGPLMSNSKIAETLNAQVK